MTCPQCHVQNSRFSDVCIHCGARLRADDKATQLPLSPTTLLTPNIPKGDFDVSSSQEWTPRIELAPSSIATRKRRSRFQWNVPALLLVLGISALAGRAIHHVSGSQRAGEAEQVFQTSVGSIEEAQAAENAAVVKQSNSREKPPQATEINITDLRRAKQMDVPFPNYIPSSQKLRLQYSAPVSNLNQSQVTECYARWKWRQSEDPSKTERLMELYSSDAQILLAPGKKISVNELRPIITEMRFAGFFTSALDQTPPHWVQNATGDRVELLAFHLYTDDSNNLLWGQRHLVWQKQGAHWLIIRDEFPPCYFSKN